MPELPEVEVTRQSFASQIAGAQITALHLGKPLRWPLGLPPERLVGKTVQTVRRRGKYLLIDLDNGLLMLHLGMSGSVRFGPHLGDLALHDHVQLITTQGELRLNDPRRFGALVYSTSESVDPARKLLSKLGVEPLTEAFTAPLLYQGLQQRRISIKQALLAGDIVVGVGNIYASEALFRAGIKPTTAANRISQARSARLHAAIVQVLQIALTHGGSTLRNFSNAQGKTGYFQLEVMVYGRTGQACHVCSTPIKHLVQGQRSTFYCPKCQR